MIPLIMMKEPEEHFAGGGVKRHRVLALGPMPHECLLRRSNTHGIGSQVWNGLIRRWMLRSAVSLATLKYFIAYS